MFELKIFFLVILDKSLIGFTLQASDYPLPVFAKGPRLSRLALFTQGSISE